MQLWPVLLWPKPKARQHTQHNGSSNSQRNINLQFQARTLSTPAAAATISTTILSTFVINALLSIATTWGLTVAQQPTANYEGVNAVVDVDMVSALTGLSNGYATPNYIQKYYQVREAEATKQQLQQQQQSNDAAAAVKSGHQEEMGNGGIIGRGFVGLQSNNYGNSVVARGAAAKGGLKKGDYQEEASNVYDGGFVPTTFTAAGQHYAASLVGLQNAGDKSNTLHHYATTAANKNNLHAYHLPYGNVYSNNNNNLFVADPDNKAQHSLFRRLSNYGGPVNGESGGGSRDTSTTDTDDADDDTSAGTSSSEGMQNYALAYADDAQQSSLLQNFYNQQQQHQNPTFNDAHAVQEQTYENYFPSSMAAAAGYEIENQQKYYTLNNYQQTTKPQQQFAQQQQYLHPFDLQQQQQIYNKIESQTAAPAPPATYYQTFIQHKNDNKEHHHQHRHIAADNFHRWKQNQITANYQPKQLAIEKHQQQQQQQEQRTQSSSQYQQHHSIQEPETAETSHSARIKKSPKHKSKRHDNHELHEHNYSYDTLQDDHENTIEHGSGDFSIVQLRQLEQLQQQLQQQQQQFADLQHQLIDHDQQLQIHKHIAHPPPPTLPPITHTVRHNQLSLQAIAGTPLSKHIQVIKSVPIPQHRQVHVPYRENVTIEVPDVVIDPVKNLMPIEIPVTKTVTIPKIHEVKIPIEKVRPFPVERPIPYIVEKRVPYTVEKQIAQPVYYPMPIKVPILHTVIHRVHKHPHHRHHPSYHLPHTVFRKGHGHSSYY